MKRLFKNYLTSILGTICIGVAIYMFLSKNHTSIEAGELVILGLIFLRSKDSLIDLNNKND